MVWKCVKITIAARYDADFNVNGKDDEFDKVLGLELGADDYMTKPFSQEKLLLV